MTLRSQGVPPHRVLAAILRDVLRPGVQRVVRGGVANVDEGGLVGVGGFVDLENGVISKRVSPSFELGIGLRWIEEIATTIQEPVERIKASLVRVRRLAASQMPFARKRSLIPSFLEGFAERHHILLQQPALAAPRVKPGN